jgi:hypothetical protein
MQGPHLSKMEVKCRVSAAEGGPCATVPVICNPYQVQYSGIYTLYELYMMPEERAVESLARSVYTAQQRKRRIRITGIYR